MNKELFEKFMTLAKEKGFAPNLDEVNYETAKQLTELNKTQNTQLAILTMSLAITKLLETEGIKADISAGLSLGEYSALINSKTITIEDGLNIVKARGKYE